VSDQDEVMDVGPDDGTDGAAGDDGATGDDEVVWELGEWDAGQRLLLEGALVDAGIPHAWEVGDLVTRAVYEAEVEALLDELDTPAVDDLDELEETTTEDGGEEAQEAMSDLFVAADRLMHDPGDVEVVDDLLAAAGSVDTLLPPFGVAPGAWDQVRALAAAVRDDLDADADDDVVVRDAQALRDVLRRYV
jgi:hypothetical protein